MVDKLDLIVQVGQKWLLVKFSILISLSLLFCSVAFASNDNLCSIALSSTRVGKAFEKPYFLSSDQGGVAQYGMVEKGSRKLLAVKVGRGPTQFAALPLGSNWWGHHGEIIGDEIVVGFSSEHDNKIWLEVTRTNIRTPNMFQRFSRSIPARPRQIDFASGENGQTLVVAEFEGYATVFSGDLREVATSQQSPAGTFQEYLGVIKQGPYAGVVGFDSTTRQVNIVVNIQRGLQNAGVLEGDAAPISATRHGVIGSSREGLVIWRFGSDRMAQHSIDIPTELKGLRRFGMMDAQAPVITFQSSSSTQLEAVSTIDFKAGQLGPILSGLRSPSVAERGNRRVVVETEGERRVFVQDGDSPYRQLGTLAESEGDLKDIALSGDGTRLHLVSAYDSRVIRLDLRPL